MSVSRRGFLAGGAAVASSSLLSSCTTDRDAPPGVPSNSDPDREPLRDAAVEFDGEHQAGIATPTQASLNLVGFNLRDGVDKAGLNRLLRLWTEDARELASGHPPVGSLEPEMNQWPANLTITAGVGARCFDIAAPGQKPAWLRPITAMRRDALRDEWGQSDLVLQICADDPVMCAWAMRHMTRAGADYARTAWVQQGFMNAFGAIPTGQTPRNLFGQVDGTVNPYSEEEYREQVWADGPAGFAGGTSMVVRRIAMHLDEWEKLDRGSREAAIGRKLADGAPLSGGDEYTPADFSARDSYGLPAIDPHSHMARATAPADHPEQRFKRRPYNYNLPPAPGDAAGAAGAGELSNAGLIFIAFQKDPDVQFTPVLSRLDESDRLNEWTTHIGSAVYWVPPGTGAQAGRDAYWGQSVLGA